MVEKQGSESMASSSVVFYMVELIWFFNTLNQFLTIFYVGGVILDLGVKDVAQAMLPHENVRQYSDAFFHFVGKAAGSPHLL